MLSGLRRIKKTVTMSPQIQVAQSCCCALLALNCIPSWSWGLYSFLVLMTVFPSWCCWRLYSFLALITVFLPGLDDYISLLVLMTVFPYWYWWLYFLPGPDGLFPSWSWWLISFLVLVIAFLSMSHLAAFSALICFCPNSRESSKGRATCNTCNWKPGLLANICKWSLPA